MQQGTIPTGTVELTMRDGQYRLHSASCRDLTYERRDAQNVETVEQGTVREYAEWLFGDIASDQADEGTPEWEEALGREFDATVKILPCVSVARLLGH